uniref:Uncharacterized protein n=1 Tax=Molossus molossus TaxID=27622 RepID=A0A7J8CZ73_MOLMO|nr:hypothetical protein HJG59_009478 [Molossus molossus]
MSTRKMGRFVPCPFVFCGYFPAVKKLNRYSGEIFLYCFPFPVKTKITDDDTLGGRIETKTQLLNTQATGSWFKPLVCLWRFGWSGEGGEITSAFLSGRLVVFVFVWGGGRSLWSGVEYASYSEFH